MEKVEPSIINGQYVSSFLGNVITIRDKDWAKIKDAFVIPKSPSELEKGAIYLLAEKGRMIKYELIGEMQKDLFSEYDHKE